MAFTDLRFWRAHIQTTAKAQLLVFPTIYLTIVRHSSCECRESQLSADAIINQHMSNMRALCLPKERPADLSDRNSIVVYWYILIYRENTGELLAASVLGRENMHCGFISLQDHIKWFRIGGAQQTCLIKDDICNQMWLKQWGPAHVPWLVVLAGLAAGKIPLGQSAIGKIPPDQSTIMMVAVISQRANRPPARFLLGQPATTVVADGSITNLSVDHGQVCRAGSPRRNKWRFDIIRYCSGYFCCDF